MHAFFPPEFTQSTEGEEQILLLPFSEDNTSLATKKANSKQLQCSNVVNFGKVPITEHCHPSSPTIPQVHKLKEPTLCPTENYLDEGPDKQREGPPRPKTTGVSPEKHHPRVDEIHIKSTNSEVHQDRWKPGTPTSTDTGTIVLKYISQELLTSVINLQNKTSLNTWLTSLGFQHTNNLSKSKIKLCDLLNECMASKNPNAMPLVKNLISKLQDPIIQLELSDRGCIPMSSTAVERKRNLISSVESDNSSAHNIVFEARIHEASTISTNQPGPSKNHNTVDTHDSEPLATTTLPLVTNTPSFPSTGHKRSGQKKKSKSKKKEKRPQNNSKKQ